MLFALAWGRRVPHWICPFPQHLMLGLSTLHPRCVLRLGNEGLREVQRLVAAFLASSLKEALPVHYCLGKPLVRWLHCTAWRHYPQYLIPLSGLGRCSHADSIVHSGLVTAPREHGICCIVFPQCMVHWNDGEPWHVGVKLITLARWRQRWPIRVDLHGCYGQWYPWRSWRSWWRHHYLWCLSSGPCIAT